MEIETFFHYKSVPDSVEKKKMLICFADCIRLSAKMSYLGYQKHHGALACSAEWVNLPSQEKVNSQPWSSGPCSWTTLLCELT